MRDKVSHVVLLQVIPPDTFTNAFTVNGWSYMLSVKVLIMVYLNSAANPIIYYTRRVVLQLIRHDLGSSTSQ